MTEEQLEAINYLTEEQYQQAKDDGTIYENELYMTPNNSIEQNKTDYIDNQIIATNEFLNGNRIYIKRIVTTNTISSSNNHIVQIPHGIINFDDLWVDIANSHMYANKDDSNDYIDMPITSKFYTDNSNNNEISATIVGNNILIISNGSWGTNWTKIITIKFTYKN